MVPLEALSNDLLPQKRINPTELFPSPAEGDIIEFTPPAFHWLKVDSVSSYRIIVEDGGVESVVDETVSENYLVLHRVLPSGRYRWNLIAEGRQRGWQSFEIAEDAIEHVVPTAAEILSRIPHSHPRHVYYPEDIERIVEHHQPQLEVLKRNITLAVRQGLPPHPQFHRADDIISSWQYAHGFRVHREYVDRNLTACALGYLFLGDSDAAECAKLSMLEICDWNPEGPCAVDGPWGDEIGLSNARCLFAVYDWTYPLYTEKEHDYIQKTLLLYARQILRTLRKQDFFNYPGDSHSGRLPGYLGEAALVLHGHAPPNEVREWLQYALDVYASFFPHFGGRDGGWAEGTFYGSSYTKWYLPFFFAIERHTGFSFLDYPFYQRVSQFFLHFSPPGWEIHPFCDGYWISPEDEEYPGFSAQNPFAVYAERFGPALARQYSDAIAVPPDVFEMHLMDVFRLPHKPIEPDVAGPVSQSRVFRDAGFVSIHSDIENSQSDTALLVRASKFGSVSHQHADQGNFAIISRGRGLISPSGYFGAWSDHHSQWTKQTRAHNCILVNGKGQEVDSHLAVGSIEYLSEKDSYALTSLNLSKAYPDLLSYHRRLLFIRPGLILVYDNLRADHAVECTWLAHALSKPKIEDSRVTIMREPASLQIRLFTQTLGLLVPECTNRFGVDVNAGVPVGFHQHYSPERDHLKNAVQYHLSWKTSVAQSHRFVAVFSVNSAAVSAHVEKGKLLVEYDTHHLVFELSTDKAESILLNGQGILINDLTDQKKD